MECGHPGRSGAFPRRPGVRSFLPVKKPLPALALLVVLLTAVALWNALRHGPAPRAASAGPPSGETLDEQTIAEHLAAAIRFRTVSHQDPKDDDRTIFAGFREFLASTYPKVHAVLKRELVNEDGLLYEWQGSDPSLTPVLFMAHQDVVPIEPGTDGKWSHPPFDGVIADGFVKVSDLCNADVRRACQREGIS